MNPIMTNCFFNGEYGGRVSVPNKSVTPKKWMKSALCYLFAALAVHSCTPDKKPYAERPVADATRIDSVRIVTNSSVMYGDGRATMDLKPVLYSSDANGNVFQIVEDEIPWDLLEYTATNGVNTGRFFSTTDQNLFTREVTVSLKVKSTGLVSEPATFTVLEPLTPQQEIIIPVIFHVIQTEDDINLFGGKFPTAKIDQLLNKINNAFNGVSTNPVSLKTRIVFKPALYDPFGNKLAEKGVNRMVTKTIAAGASNNRFADFVIQHKLEWPAMDYLNIWLVSDRINQVGKYFGYSVSSLCLPKFYRNATASDVPEGLNLSENADPAFGPYTTGIFYKLQNINMINRTLGSSASSIGDNELIHYIGSYLGLLPTFKFYSSSASAANDYCDDTIDYFVNFSAGIDDNKSLVKFSDGHVFRAENIMDDPMGVHTAVSGDQYERIVWVLNHCPGREFWKSGFAFTGIR